MSSSCRMPVALTLASLTFVILPSGLIAASESRLDSIMDRAVSNAFRAWVEFRGLNSATRSSLRWFARGSLCRCGREQSMDRHVDERANVVLGHVVVEQLAG
jgi:hypothetical protein